MSQYSSSSPSPSLADGCDERPIRLVVALGLSLSLVSVLVPLTDYVRLVLVGCAGLTVYLRVWRRPRAVVLGGLYILGWFVFGLVRGFVDVVMDTVHYSYPIAFSHVVWRGSLATLWLQTHLHVVGAIRLLDVIAVALYLSYFWAPHLVALWLWLTAPDHSRRYLVTLFTSLVISLVLIGLLPTAPPWLAARQGYIPPVERIVAQVTAPASTRSTTTSSDTSARTNTQPATAGDIRDANPTAAMPSVHMVVAMVIALALWRRCRWSRPLGAAYAAAMAAAVIYLGEHYLIDTLAGIGVALGAWFACGCALHRASRSGQRNADSRN